MNKCILIIGRESTGSKLIAKIIAHVFGVAEYGSWEGHDLANEKKEGHVIVHKSLPNDTEWIDINQFIKDYNDYEIYFVITTRDKTLTTKSREKMYSQEHVQLDPDGLIARNLVLSIINSDNNYFIWSYEAFMYLGLDYTKPLMKFLGLADIILPEIELSDANPKRIEDFGTMTVCSMMENYLE